MSNEPAWICAVGAAVNLFLALLPASSDKTPEQLLFIQRGDAWSYAVALLLGLAAIIMAK